MLIYQLRVCLGRGSTCWALGRYLARRHSLGSAGSSPSWLAGVPAGWRHMDRSLCRAVGSGSPGLRAPGSCDRRTCSLHVGFEVSLCLWAPLRRHQRGCPCYTLALKLLWRVICCARVRRRKPELGRQAGWCEIQAC